MPNGYVNSKIIQKGEEKADTPSTCIVTYLKHVMGRQK